MVTTMITWIYVLFLSLGAYGFLILDENKAVVVENLAASGNISAQRVSLKMDMEFDPLATPFCEEEGTLRYSHPRRNAFLCNGYSWLQMGVPVSNEDYGTHIGVPGESCSEIYDVLKTRWGDDGIVDGVYYVKDRNGIALPVWCKMEGEADGWMLLMRIVGTNRLHAVSNDRLGVFPCHPSDSSICKMSSDDISFFIAKPGMEILYLEPDDTLRWKTYLRPTSDEAVWPYQLESYYRDELIAHKNTSWIVTSYETLEDAEAGINVRYGRYASTQHYFPLQQGGGGVNDYDRQMFFSAGDGVRLGGDTVGWTNNLYAVLWMRTSRVAQQGVYGTIDNPGSSCDDILMHFPFSPDGVYFIELGTKEPLQVYCRMTSTVAGAEMLDGWTLLSRISDNTNGHATYNDRYGRTPCSPTGPVEGQKFSMCKMSTVEVTDFIQQPGDLVFHIIPDAVGYYSKFVVARNDDDVWPDNLEANNPNLVTDPHFTWVRETYSTLNGALDNTSGVVGTYNSGGHWYPHSYPEGDMFFFTANNNGMRSTSTTGWLDNLPGVMWARKILPNRGSNVATPARSCSDILLENPIAVDGIYYLGLDIGVSPVYCEMSEGYTLVMRVNGSSKNHVKVNDAIGEAPCLPDAEECKWSMNSISHVLRSKFRHLIYYEPDDLLKYAPMYSVVPPFSVWPDDLRCSEGDFQEANENWILTSYRTEADAIAEANPVVCTYRGGSDHYLPCQGSEWFLTTYGYGFRARLLSGSYDNGVSGKIWIKTLW